VAAWRPDPDSPQFTLAVMPDTQFLYSYPSITPEPQLASFRYILDRGNGNIVFLAHLGDLTEDGLAAEFQHVSDVFGVLDAHGAGYSVLAGNHDVDASTDDQRGPTPYLDTMGPQRIRNSPSFLTATPDGYNTAHVFTAAGREWLLLALDWRMSPGGFSWANKIIQDRASLPVILTTHEIAAPTYSDASYPYQYGDPEHNAELSSYGQQLWDQLIKDNDQIFLTLNGHYLPPGRVTLTNSAGHDVHVHITNYQNRGHGGAAMIRLYHFDLQRNRIDVETIAPFLLATQEARLTTPTDYFSVPIDFTQRFAGFAPVPARPACSAGAARPAALK
jgi:hypothetical protein